jgi:hypothetical protein
MNWIRDGIDNPQDSKRMKKKQEEADRAKQHVECLVGDEHYVDDDVVYDSIDENIDPSLG